MANFSTETAEQNWARAHRAVEGKRKEVGTAITADNEMNEIIWRFEECEDLWKNIEKKHEDYINRLDQLHETNLLQTQEAWLAEVQQSFLELKPMKAKHQKKRKKQAKRNLPWTRKEGWEATTVGSGVEKTR